MIISDRKQVGEKISTVKNNMQKTVAAAAELFNESNAFEALLQLKFDQTGYEPCSDEDEKCNFIEALNQSFSDLVVYNALLKLLDIYPDTQFKVNLGAKSGFDIVSTDLKVFAECFSVVSVKNNRKLQKDADKLNRKAPEDADKFIFFYSHNDSEDMIEHLKNDYKEKMNIDLVPITETDLKN